MKLFLAILVIAVVSLQGDARSAFEDFDPKHRESHNPRFKRASLPPKDHKDVNDEKPLPVANNPRFKRANLPPKDHKDVNDEKPLPVANNPRFKRANLPPKDHKDVNDEKPLPSARKFKRSDFEFDLEFDNSDIPLGVLPPRSHNDLRMKRAGPPSADLPFRPPRRRNKDDQVEKQLPIDRRVKRHATEPERPHKHHKDSGIEKPNPLSQ